MNVGWRAIDALLYRTSPPAAGTRPITLRSVVDFPAPFAPMRVTISPFCSVSETPFSAQIAP
jgi:hypothetical protein